MKSVLVLAVGQEENKELETKNEFLQEHLLSRGVTGSTTQDGQPHSTGIEAENYHI